MYGREQPLYTHGQFEKLRHQINNLLTRERDLMVQVQKM